MGMRGSPTDEIFQFAQLVNKFLATLTETETGDDEWPEYADLLTALETIDRRYEGSSE